MKQGRLHTGPPVALQPLQAEMARKKSLPQDETTQDKSHVVTVTTCDSEHSIQGAVLRRLCKSYDLCYPFISFVWFTLISKHFLDLTKRTFLNLGQPTHTICSVLKKKSQNENKMLKFC